MADEAKLSDLIELEEPIVRGDSTIASLRLRRPTSGELRGLSLAQLSQLDTDTVLRLLPRISLPPITPAEADSLDPADLAVIAEGIVDFLLTKARKRQLAALQTN